VLKIIKEKYFAISMKGVYLLEVKFERSLCYKVSICAYSEESKKSDKVLLSLFYDEFYRSLEAYDIIIEGLR
jgi:hypothetical protein